MHPRALLLFVLPAATGCAYNSSISATATLEDEDRVQVTTRVDPAWLDGEIIDGERAVVRTSLAPPVEVSDARLTVVDGMLAVSGRRTEERLLRVEDVTAIEVSSAWTSRSRAKAVATNYGPAITWAAVWLVLALPAFLAR